MFNFKLLHRILNVNYYLKFCNLTDSDACVFCGQIETIEHVFLECHTNSEFLTKCKNWIYNVTGITFNISNSEYILGLTNELHNSHLEIYNRFLSLVVVTVFI